jgi:hypothetical protein
MACRPGIVALTTLIDLSALGVASAGVTNDNLSISQLEALVAFLTQEVGK